MKIFRKRMFSSTKLTNWQTWKSSSDWLIAMKHEIGPNLHSIRPDTYLKERNKVFRKMFFSSISSTKLTNWRTWRSSSEWLMAMNFKIGPNMHSIRQDTYLKERKKVFRKLFILSVSSTLLTSWRFEEALLIDWSPWNIKYGIFCIQYVQILI